MARNIEIKARLADVAACVSRIAAITDVGPADIAQDDTFFRCEAGRLKLRVFADGTGELIFYRRADRRGPKESFYVRSPAAAPDALRECLRLAYGVSGRVVKLRRLYLAGRTRIHVDEVQGLGAFLELEVVLDDGESSEAGEREARQLMSRLGISPDQLVETAYVDLLAQCAAVMQSTSA